MWELTKLTSRGGLSARRIFTYALAAILAVFLWTILLAPQTHAADPASWNGDTITYANNQYFNQGKAKAGDSINLPVDSSYYTHIENTNDQPLTQKAYVIYFAPGQDPGATTTARYAVYDFANKTYSNPQNDQAISIGPNSVINQISSSCAVPGGLGWIICPASVTIATGMDWVLGVISSFLQVQPASVGDSHNVMFVAWNLMRSFANIAFIIVFLIIIYSQLANAGISNYGIKKLLPRLIVAAVLVNISYYMCAIAIDISNVLGYSIQDFFKNIQTSLTNTANGTMNASIWSVQSITSFVLSGGTAAIAGAGGLLIATGGSIASAIFLLLPVLVGLFLAILVAFLILAARQALIVILLIISPLAFVANLLPNTEKWFTEWRKLFTTMLVFFPAFAVVFAGAQVAGNIIVQNAASINIVILGLIVKLAPLAISPLLLKLSGSFLGKIAALANTPNKLIKDRAKQWSNERSEMYRRRALGAKNLGPVSTRRAAQFFDSRARRVKERSEIYEKMADNRYNSSHGGGKYSPHALHELKHEVETEGKKIEQQMERDLNIKIRATPEMLKKEMEVRTLTDQAEAAKGRLDTIHENIKSGAEGIANKSYGKLLTELADQSKSAALDISLSAIAKQNAQRIQQDNLSTALLKNTTELINEVDAAGVRVTTRQYAAGSDIENGEASALTFAVNQQREAINKLITERTQLIKHFKLDGTKRQNLAEGDNVTTSRDGIEYTFTGQDAYAREAAVEMQLKTGSYEEIEAIVALSGVADNEDVIVSRGGKPKVAKGGFSMAQTIGDAIFANGIANKGMFLGGRFINNVSKGDIKGETGLNWGVTMSILDGKIKAEDLANNDAGAIKRYLNVAKASQRGNYESNAIGREREMDQRVLQLKETAREILDPTNDIGKNAAQSTKDALQNILDQI